MDAIRRRKQIMDSLNKTGDIRTEQLCKKLDTSRETIRKDIYFLEKKGLLTAVRGGAVLPSVVKETRYNQRQGVDVSEKVEMAHEAMKKIKDGQSIFLDYGTSCFEVAKLLKNSDLSNITLVTTSVPILEELRYSTNVNLVFLGGGLRVSEGSVFGPLTLSNIDKIFCDIGIFGCGGISIRDGLSNHYFQQIEVSQKMMKHCSYKMVLADHTKFNKNAFYKLADITDVDVIITDSKIDSALVDGIKKTGTELIK